MFQYFGVQRLKCNGGTVKLLVLLRQPTVAPGARPSNMNGNADGGDALAENELLATS